MKKLKWYQRRLNEFNEQHKHHYAEPVSRRLQKKHYTCNSCGEVLPVDEICSPMFDGDTIICDECYDELYRFLCPLCGDLDEKEECDDIGSIIILTNQEDEKVIPGAYKIIEFPYARCSDPYMKNLKRVGDYTHEHPFDYDDCFTGTVKVCRTCQEDILKCTHKGGNN